MARLPRLAVGGFPHHVVQRGNNGQAVFSVADDYRHFLSLLERHAKAQQVAVHAYVLTTSQFDLLATPVEAEGLSRMMQSIGRHYVRYFNDRNQRTGTLWDGRFRSALLEPDRYLLDCMTYMDLRAVREGLVTEPDAYPWSSYGFYTAGRPDPIVTPHALHWKLGNTPFAREAAYAERVRAGLSVQMLDRFSKPTTAGWILGESAYVAQIQQLTPRRVSKGRPGRPRRSSDLSPNTT